MWGADLIIRYLSHHFVLGFVVGLLVFWLILTIYPYLRTYHWRDWKVGRSMFHWLLLLVCALSIVSHVLEDWLVNKF